MVLSSISLFANQYNITLRTGMLSPDSDLEPGIIGGISLGYYLTPSIEVQLSMDYYRQSNVTHRKHIQTDTPYERLDILSDVESTFIPLSLNLQYNMALTERFIPVFGGGLGVGFLRESVEATDPAFERDYASIDSYQGFNSLVWTGFKYRLNPNLNLLSKVLYRYSELTGSYDLEPFGFVENRQDMSGIGFNLGIEYRF